MFFFYRQKFANFYFDLLYSAAAHSEPDMATGNEPSSPSNRLTDPVAQSSVMDGDTGQISSTEISSSGDKWYP